jgi:hypothetical protein
MNDDLFGTPEPAPRKLTEKQRRRQAPEPRVRAPRIDLSPEAKAIRTLHEWGMLSPEAQKEQADVIETAISDTSREEFRQWRQDYGNGNHK